jgi:general secretion pathway protein I
VRLNNKGFTLLEVLIAMIIIAGAVMVLANSWSGSFMQIRKSRLNNNVAVLLERKMIEVEAKYKNKFTEVPETDGGDFEDDPDYSWKLKSKDIKVPDLTALLMSESGEADETLISMIKQMTEYLNKTIKEVKVTIVFKGPRKTMEYSATTYLVDFGQDLGLGGGAGGAGGGGNGGGGNGSGGGGGNGGGGGTDNGGGGGK